MFEDRIRNLLEIIGYDLCGLYLRQLSVLDRKSPNPAIEVITVPGELVSDDQSRKFECSWNDNIQWFQVRLSQLNPDDIHFFRASTQTDLLGNDYISCELEDKGCIYSLLVGKHDYKNECHYRKLDIVENKPFTTDIEWREGEFTVSRSFSGSTEKINLHPLSDKQAIISFYRDGELLETKEVQGFLSYYYSSVLSAASNVVVEANRALYRVNPNILNSIEKEYKSFRKFLSYQDGCYEADGLDDLYRKHSLFTEPNMIQKRQ